VLLDGLEQGHALVTVARLERVGQAHGAAPDRILEMCNDEPLAGRGHTAIAEVDNLREVVPRVDMQQRERQAAAELARVVAILERLLGQAQRTQSLPPENSNAGRSKLATSRGTR
jgi:hypothetical protein